MKKLVLVAALASLSACGGAVTEEEAPAEATEMMADENATLLAADGGPTVGTYKVTNAAGEVSTEVIAEDGTYTSTNAAGEVSTGTWEQKSPTEYCTQPSDAEKMTCFAEMVGDDGVWTSTDPDDGEVSIIERVETETAEG
jgi:hypothetical protein